MKNISVLTVLVFLLTVNGIYAAEKMIRLPLPQKSGGKSIMECLTLRRSVKSFLPGKKLSAQHLSNVLYAADGINRPDNRRTIPTARNLQNQTVYAVLREGIYQYESVDNTANTINYSPYTAAVQQKLKSYAGL